MLKHIREFFDLRVLAAEEYDTEHALQLATAALLIEASRADARVATAEQAAILEAVGQTFDLDDDETASLLTLAQDQVDETASLFEFTRLLNEHFSAKQKVHVVELLWKVAYADSNIDKYEDYYIRKVAELLYVTHTDFIRMKHRVMAKPREPGP